MQRFEEIYERNEWGAASRSGPGSVPSEVGPYLAMLQRELGRLRPGRVVDVGCGDWAFSHLVDWSGTEYVGVDVVPSVIGTLNARYGAPSVRFVCGDIREMPLPHGDLLLVKDVLQHWPNRDVLEFLPKIARFQWTIVTNDVAVSRRDWRTAWRSRPMAQPNVDTCIGGYRPLSLREGPFHLRAEPLLRWEVSDGPIRFLKESLLVGGGIALDRG